MRRITMAFLVLVGVAAGLASVATAEAQSGGAATQQNEAGAQKGESGNPLAASRVFAYDEMVAKTAANGSVGRNVFSGTLATGEAIAVHETVQPKGTAPNPAHRIQHSELIVVEEGTLEYSHDGKVERADAGSVIYVAFGTLHAVRNVGDGPAKYVVIQIGGDTR